MDFDKLSKEELIKLLQQREKTLTEELNKKDIEIQKYQNDIKERDDKIAEIEAQNKKLNIKIDKLIKKYEVKMAINKKMIADKFGKKTEKQSSSDAVINEADSMIEKTKKERKTPTENFVTDLKTLSKETIILDYDFEANNIDKDSVKEFGMDETYKVNIEPVSFSVTKYERPKYKDRNNIYQALSNDPFPHSVLTPSLAANILIMKYELSVPLYRYSDYLCKNGLNISQQTLSNYVQRAVEKLEPLYNRLLSELFNNSAKCIHVDETTLQVIDSPKSNCYMFVYTTSFWDNPIYIYEFNENRTTDKLSEHLSSFDGYLICDGYKGYNKFSTDKIKIQRCFVHLRRYFVDSYKILNKSKQKGTKGYKVVELMTKIFNEEKEFLDKPLTADEIKAKRGSDCYKGYIKELDDYILDIDEKKNILLTKAVDYYKKYKSQFYTFLLDGHIDISNNLAERTVRPFKIASKNFMFCKTEDGAEITAKAFSVVQTARANGLKAERYLRYVFENIDSKPLEELLPWSSTLPEEVKITAKDLSETPKES